MQSHYCLLTNRLNRSSTTHSFAGFSANVSLPITALLLVSTLGLITQRSYAIGISPAPFQQSTASSTSTPKTPICTGQPANPKQANSSSEDTSVDDQDKKDKLKLSTGASSEKQSNLQGEFCKREQHRESGAWKPSTANSTTETPAQADPPPAAQPIAVFSGGKLTIRAHGEDLTAVMNAVQSATGMTVEAPAGGENESFYVDIGPAPMRDALVALLDGSKYNYLIQSSSQNPEIAKRLILSTKTSKATVAIASAGVPVEQEKTGLYGSQGFEDDQQQGQAKAESQLPLPAQPTAVPASVPVGVNVQQMATDSHRSVGEVLADLQKKQQQVLDDQAASQPQPPPQQ